VRYHDNTILCLEYAELVPLIISSDAYKWSKKRGKLTTHGRGGNGNKVLIEFESLPQKYKERVIEHYGNPYEYVAQQPILSLISFDKKAHDFYSGFILPNGLHLPDKYVERYTTNANWLNMIIHLTTDKKALKNDLNISVTSFWDIVTRMIKTRNVKLPSSEKRLKENIKEYQQDGYRSLIDVHRFGNSNSRKIDDTAKALLIEMLSNDHQHDDTIVAKAYNNWAVQNEREVITPGAVAYWRKQCAHLITQGREGKAKNYNKFVPQIKRERPSAPLLLINSDDNVLDLYFKLEKTNAKGYNVLNHYYRPVLYVVMDAFNDYILGYAIGEEVTIDLIRAAYHNAIHHIIEITGGAFLPHQITTDRWGLDPKLKGELGTFYKSMATATPATARVAQGKYIERSFGQNWHQLLKMFPNYSGFNITAKQRISPEAIEKNKSIFPTKDKAPEQVAMFINALRAPRQQQWLEAFHNSEKSKEKSLSTEYRLKLFGVEHKPKNGRSGNTLTSGQLEIQISNKRHLFEIPSYLFPENAGKKVQVIYDPYDMSKVLVTDGKGLRFIAENYIKSPSALADFTEGDRLLLNSRLEEKKRIASIPGEAAAERKVLLEREKIDADSVIQGGVLIKQVRHAAEKSIKGFIPEKADEELVIVQQKQEKQTKSFLDRI